MFTKVYLGAKGAEYLLRRIPGGTRGGIHIDGAQVPGDTKRIITIGGGGILTQTARDLAGRSIPMLGANRGHLGYLNQVSRREDIIPILESLLNERYQLERRMMIHGTAWRKEEILLKDTAPNEIAITREDPLKVLHYSICVNDEYLNGYATDSVLVAAPAGPTTYNLFVGGPVMAPGARVMVPTPICSHSLNVGSIVLVPKDRVRVKAPNGSQVVSFDGDMSMELKAGDCIDIRYSKLQTVMVELKQISFMQNLSDHLGRLQTAGVAGHYKSTRREASHMKIEYHSKIVELTGKYEIEIQEEPVKRLNEIGLNVTQVTVSRGIRELKLTKMQSKSGRQRYMVSESPRGTSAIKYIRTLKDGYVSMDMARDVLVVKTVSGMVMAVAAVLDAVQFHKIVDCIAGDDTIMCAIRSMDDIIIVMEKIKRMVED